MSMVSGSQKKPKTAFGGLLTIIVIPVAVLLYSFTWFNTWFNGNLGASQETLVRGLQYGTGTSMDGDEQGLYCMAVSGCWYTRYTDRSQCPPPDVIRVMRQKTQNANELFRTGNVRNRNFAAANKECAYAARGERLSGVCLHATPDPIDRLQVTWLINSNSQRVQNNFGVALMTETMRDEGAQGIEAREETTPVPESAVELSGISGQWFEWSTDGGGRGSTVAQMGTELHYGSVDLQILDYDYELATPKSSARQLVPQYSHLNPTPVPTNICWQQSGPNPVDAQSGVTARCEDGRAPNGQAMAVASCAELSISPATVTVTDRRTISPPWNSFLGAIGGIFSLIVLFLTLINSICRLAFKDRCSLCTPPTSGTAAVSRQETKV